MAIANRKIRSSMLLSTAMAALVAVPGVANAQLVRSGDLVDAIDSGGNAGRLTVVDVDATRTDMTVLSRVVVANWNRFNVPANTTVNIARDAALTDATLVNRVIGADMSVIRGSINAPEVNLWLINQNGILFGDGAAVNSASFFASTIDVANQDLFDFYEGTDLFGNGAGTLNFAGSLGNAVRTNSPNVSFVTDGSMMFVSEQLNLNATFDAGSGDVSFVTAADVDVTFTPGSPLVFSVNAGTTVARGQTIAGSVTGNNVDFHMMTAAGVTDAVLRVDATVNATQAEPTATGIRLFADSADATVSVIINGEFSSTGRVDLDTDGDLFATGNITGSGIDIDAGGAARLADLTATNGGIDVAATLISAGNAAAQGGNVNLLSSGRLDVADVTATGGAVQLEALGGNLTAGNVSGSDGIVFAASNTGRATFASLVSTGGIVQNMGLTPSVIRVNGETRGEQVFLSAQDSISLGNVAATAGNLVLFTLNDNIVAGDVSSTAGGITITSGRDILAGAVQSQGGSVIINGQRNVTTASITSLAASGIGGFINVTGTTGALNLGVINAAADIAIDTLGQVTTAAIDAGGALAIGGTSAPSRVTLTGDVSARSIDITTSGNLTAMNLNTTFGSIDLAALAIVAGDIEARRGDVNLLATNAITTGAIAARQIESASGAITVASSNGGALQLGDLTADLGIALDTLGSIDAGIVTARGGALRVGGTERPNAVTFTGDAVAQSIGIDVLGTFTGTGLRATAGDLRVDASAISAGAITATGGNVDLLASGAVATTGITARAANEAGGAIAVASSGGGALTLGDLSADLGITLETLGAVSAGAVTARGGALTVGGGGMAAAGGVTFTGNARANSISIDTTGALTALNLSAIAGDVDVDAGSIAAALVSATGGNVDLLASGAVATTGITARAANEAGGAIAVASSGGGALTLGDLSADLGITLETLGAVTAGVTNARGGALMVNGGGMAAAGSVTFTGNARANSISIDTTGALTALNLSALAGGVDVDAASIAAGAVSATDGDVRLRASGAITTASVAAKRPGGVGGAIDIDSTGGGALDLGNLVADLGITLDTLGSIAAGAVTARGGALTVGGGGMAAAGSVTFSGNARANSISIDTTGALTALNLSAIAGDVDVDAGSIAAALVSATGGNVDLLASGAVATTGITATAANEAGGAIAVASSGGGALTLGDLSADLGITLETLGAVTAGVTNARGGALTVNGGGMAAAGSVTFTGNARANSISIDTTGALTALDLNATAGGIAIDAGAIAAGALTAVGGGVDLAAVGDIATGPIRASDAIDIDSTGADLMAGDLILGDLIAGTGITLDTNGSLSAGTITVSGGALAIGGDLAPDNVSLSGEARARSIAIATTGALTGPALTATAGGIMVNAGSINAGTLQATGGGISLLTVAGIETDSIIASGAITARSSGGGAFDLGVLEAGTGITLNTTGSVTTGMITAGGALLVGNMAEPSSVTFNGDATAQSITIDTTGAFQSGALTATNGVIDIDAGAITTGAVNATNGDVILLSSGLVRTASIATNRAIDVDSAGGGLLNLGALMAGLGIALDTTGGVETGMITAGGALVVGGVREPGAVTFAGPATAQSITIDTTGAFAAGALTATNGAIDVDAGSITAGVLSATGGNVRLLTVGDITTATITATRVGNSGGAIDIDSTGTGEDAGTVTLGDLTADLGITLDAQGAIGAGTVTARNGSIAANASMIDTGAMSATAGDVVLTAVGAISTDSITATRPGNVGGAITVASTNGGALDLGDLTAGLGVTLNTAGTVRAATITAGGALIVGNLREPTTVDFTGDATASSITVMNSGAFTARGLTATAGPIMIDAGSITAQALRATGGAVNLLSAGLVDTASVNASGAINVESTGGGLLRLGALTAGQGITLDTTGRIETAGITAGGALVVGGVRELGSVQFGGDATAQSITIDTTGAFTGQALTATNGMIDIDAGTITAAALRATGGNVRLLAVNGITTGAITTNRAIDADSTAGGALDLGALNADSGITLDSTGTIRAGATSAGGDLLVGVDRQAAAVTFTGDAQAANITVNTAGLLTTAGLAARTGSITVTAADVNLGGNVTTATDGTLTFNAGRNVAIGPDAAAGQTAVFSLSNAEIARISTSNLVINSGNRSIDLTGARFGAAVGRNAIRFHAGTGNITIAGAEFDTTATAGSQPARMEVVFATTPSANNPAATGLISITGNLTGAGAARVFRLGGAADGTGEARRITANIDMATIDLGTSTLELRGRDIVFGQQQLINRVDGLTIEDLVRQFVANAGSLLYTPENLSAARIANPTYLKAGKLNVTYGGSALFQNAAPRTGGSSFAGVELVGGDTATPTLNLNPLDAPATTAGRINATNAFALFGSIDGFEGPAASLAGEAVISVDRDRILLDASRVNGCVIGSGADCVTTIVGNFVLSIPREVVSLIVAEDRLLVPFDPLVGTNNEGLFSDAATTATDDKDCKQRDANGACVGN